MSSKMHCASGDDYYESMQHDFEIGRQRSELVTKKVEKPKAAGKPFEVKTPRNAKLLRVDRPRIGEVKQLLRTLVEKNRHWSENPEN